MTAHVFEMESVRQVEALVQAVGDMEACKLLGFIAEDDRGIISLSVAGLGYLLQVRAAGVTDLAEAFAAGYDCAWEEIHAIGSAYDPQRKPG